MRLRAILLATTFSLTVIPAFAQSGVPAARPTLKAAQNAAAQAGGARAPAGRELLDLARADLR